MHVTYSQAALPTNKTAPRTTDFPSPRFFSPEPAEYTTHEQSDPYRILVRRVASGYPLESLIGIAPIEEQRLLRPASEGLNTHATCVKRHRQSWYYKQFFVTHCFVVTTTVSRSSALPLLNRCAPCVVDNTIPRTRLICFALSTPRIARARRSSRARSRSVSTRS